MGTRIAYRIRKDLRADDGVALPLVVAITMVLFILAMMLLTIVANSTVQSVKRESDTKAVHMADAGLNAYLYELRRNPNYYLSNPVLGPTSLADGSWVVTATPPAGSQPLTLRATGSIASMESTKTVLATVRFPTYADYMFLADSDINIGSGATIDGKVRSNGNVTNAGRVTGITEAVRSISGAGVFGGGKKAGVSRVDFAQVTADLADIRQAATAASVYFPASGRLGYRAQISGNRVTVSRVTSVSANGTLTLQAVGIYTIPACGVMYFDDTVWVSGTYSAKLTIASSMDIFIPENVEPQNMNSSATLGLIAAQNVIVPTWYTSVGNSFRLVAACIAQNGTVYGDLHDGVTKTKIDIVGSLAYRTTGYFASSVGNTVVSGFRTRVYDYDERLDIEPPPMFPQIKDGTLKIATWNED